MKNRKVQLIFIICFLYGLIGKSNRLLRRIICLKMNSYNKGLKMLLIKKSNRSIVSSRACHPRYLTHFFKYFVRL